MGAEEFGSQKLERLEAALRVLGVDPDALIRTGRIVPAHGKLWVESNVDGQSTEPYVAIGWEKTSIPVPTPIAVEHAVATIQKAALAEAEAFLVQYLIRYDFTKAQASSIITEFRNWRMERAAPPVSVV